MRWFLAVLRSLFHSSLSYTFSCHSSPPTIFPSSLTSSSHLFKCMRFVQTKPAWGFFCMKECSTHRHWSSIPFPHQLMDFVHKKCSRLLPDSSLYVFCSTKNYDHLLSRNTNKMQLCNRIYYSKVFWRFNMFRAARRSSSGALNCICSLCQGNSRSPYRHINQRLQIQFRAPDDEKCAARNMLSLQKTLE